MSNPEYISGGLFILLGILVIFVVLGISALLIVYIIEEIKRHRGGKDEKN